MAVRTRVVVGALGVALAACTTVSLPPTQVVRYHLGEPIDRGTIAVQPATLTPGEPASLEFRVYADAVRAELLRNGYTDAAPGVRPQLIAAVSFTRTNREGPPRSSPVSIGLGGGGFSGGGWRGGSSVGGGLGVGFPIGGGRPSELIVTELTVTIKRNSDQTRVWEGTAQSVADARKPDADAPVQAQKLAGAMFAGFPGESGRTIEVR